MAAGDLWVRFVWPVIMVSGGNPGHFAGDTAGAQAAAGSGDVESARPGDGEAATSGTVVKGGLDAVR